MKIHKNVLLGIFVITTAFICGCILNKDYDAVSTSTTILNNKCIGWGLKRAENHAQPDLGSTNKALIEKYDGIAMGNKDSKQVYLTFDLGYEAGYTAKILDTLKANKVSACFFITAHYLNTQPELVQRMIDEGHIVGNHTVNHKSMPGLSEEEAAQEIKKLHTAVFEKTGYEMKYLRPPKGEYSEVILALAKKLGYTTVMWSLAYDDWDETNQNREEYGKEKIINNIHSGAVILLHATSRDNSNILDDCIKQVQKMGYRFKSLDQFEK